MIQADQLEARSHSGSELLRRLIFGRPVRGVASGRSELSFGDYVVSLTRVGSPRMPNGIECNTRLRAHERIVIGGGRLVLAKAVVTPGPVWDPVPRVVMRRRALPAGPEPIVWVVDSSTGMGVSEYVLAGYIAGVVLLHGRRDRAQTLAGAVTMAATPLGRTLIGHAALGEVPEPVHDLFATGDARRLLSSWDATGPSWLRGLISAGYPVDAQDLAGRGAGTAGQ